MTPTEKHMIQPDALLAQLPDIGDGLAAAFITLHRAPEPASCEALAIRLHGAAQHVMRLRESLMQESGDHAA